jgi:hypothetical protein
MMKWVWMGWGNVGGQGMCGEMMYAKQPEIWGCLGLSTTAFLLQTGAPYKLAFRV